MKYINDNDIDITILQVFIVVVSIISLIIATNPNIVCGYFVKEELGQQVSKQVVFDITDNKYSFITEDDINVKTKVYDPEERLFPDVDVDLSKLSKHRPKAAIPSGGYSTLDLSNNENISVDEMNYIISRWENSNGGSPFKGNGQIFIDAAKESGLNPIYIFAHACWESDWGRSYLACDRNNYFGINAVDCNPNMAHNMGNSMYEGVLSGALWIKTNYYDEGQRTLFDMIYGHKRYAKAGDTWISGISNIMRISYSYLNDIRGI